MTMKWDVKGFGCPIWGAIDHWGSLNSSDLADNCVFLVCPFRTKWELALPAGTEMLQVSSVLPPLQYFLVTWLRWVEGHLSGQGSGELPASVFHRDHPIAMCIFSLEEWLLWHLTKVVWDWDWQDAFTWCYSDITIKGGAAPRDKKRIQTSFQRQKQMFKADRQS